MVAGTDAVFPFLTTVAEGGEINFRDSTAASAPVCCSAPVTAFITTISKMIIGSATEVEMSEFSGVISAIMKYRIAATVKTTVGTSLSCDKKSSLKVRSLFLSGRFFPYLASLELTSAPERPF